VKPRQPNQPKKLTKGRVRRRPETSSKSVEIRGASLTRQSSAEAVGKVSIRLGRRRRLVRKRSMREREREDRAVGPYEGHWVQRGEQRMCWRVVGSVRRTRRLVRRGKYLAGAEAYWEG
jgi:hypothetical protein